MVDRFDIRLNVDPVPYAVLTDRKAEPEPSEAIRERVAVARARQAERYASETPVVMGGAPVRVNAYAPPHVVGSWKLTTKAEEMRARVTEGMSSRGVHRLTKVARTIADLSGADAIGVDHMAEAAAFKVPDAA